MIYETGTRGMKVNINLLEDCEDEYGNTCILSMSNFYAQLKIYNKKNKASFEFSPDKNGIKNAMQIIDALNEWIETSKENKSMDELKQGSVAIHIDGQTHMAFILKIKDNGTTLALFFTRNKEAWNKRARKATKDELAMAGFCGKKTSSTYLAPVIRDCSEFASHNGITLPEHKTIELLKEFFE